MLQFFRNLKEILPGWLPCFIDAASDGGVRDEAVGDDRACDERSRGCPTQRVRIYTIRKPENTQKVGSL